MVSSGSEANDLALRVAGAAARPGGGRNQGGQGPRAAEHIVVLGGAYHGHTGELATGRAQGVQVSMECRRALTPVLLLGAWWACCGWWTGKRAQPTCGGPAHSTWRNFAASITCRGAHQRFPVQVLGQGWAGAKTARACHTLPRPIQARTARGCLPVSNPIGCTGLSIRCGLECCCALDAAPPLPCLDCCIRAGQLVRCRPAADHGRAAGACTWMGRLQRGLPLRR
jgi:hypothetical protein